MLDGQVARAGANRKRVALVHAGKEAEAMQNARRRAVEILEAERDELGARLTEAERHVEALMLNMEQVTADWCVARRELAESAALLRDF